MPSAREPVDYDGDKQPGTDPLGVIIVEDDTRIVFGSPNWLGGRTLLISVEWPC